MVGDSTSTRARKKEFADEAGRRKGLTNTLIDYELTYPGKKSREEILSRQSTVELIPNALFNTTTKENRYYFGDNDDVLRQLLNDKDVAGKVDLVYIDPPYGTGQSFSASNGRHAYHDELVGANFIEFLRERLILLRELLSKQGSIYVHLDNAMASQAKIILDEVFGPENFRNWITRRKSNAKNFTSRQYGNIQDYILYYTKTRSPIWNRPYEEGRIYTLEQRFPRIDEETGRRYALVPIHSRGYREGPTTEPWKGVTPPAGKHWMYNHKKLDEYDAKGEIYWSPNGNPRRKIWADESKGVAVQDVWMDFKDAHNQNIRITGYPTEKNVDLLKRIVEASSNEGGIVLDCFAGSGTTLDAASQLNRRWIGADISGVARMVTLERLLESHSLQQSLFEEPHRRFAYYSQEPLHLEQASGFVEDVSVEDGIATLVQPAECTEDILYSISGELVDGTFVYSDIQLVEDGRFRAVGDHVIIFGSNGSVWNHSLVSSPQSSLR